jgi:hypothetical protein
MAFEMAFMARTFFFASGTLFKQCPSVVLELHHESFRKSCPLPVLDERKGSNGRGQTILFSNEITTHSFYCGRHFDFDFLYFADEVQSPIELFQLFFVLF